MACVSKRRNRYVIDFYDHQGKRRWKTMPKDTTKAKAKQVLRDLEDQIARGIYLPDLKVPLFKDVAKDWLISKKPSIRESTWDSYAGHLRNHFDTIDPVKINRINLRMVERFIAEKQDQMALETLRKIIKTFNQVMKYAIRHRYIDYNPVADAERPRGKGSEKKTSMVVLAPDQITGLLRATKNMKYRVLFMLAIMSGARQGELLGLKWPDVLWESNQIHIQRTYNKGRWYRPKSAASDRKVDLGASVMQVLKKWQLACPSSELELVFPNHSGNPINQSNMLSRHFYPALKAANLPRIRFHDMRHTFASLLIDQGENIKYIQTQMGHYKPTMTLDVYAHLMESTNPMSATRLERTVFGETGSKMVALT